MWLNQELSIFLIFWLSGPLTFLAGPSKSLSMYVVLSVWYEFACQKSKLIRHSSFVVIVHDVQNSKSSHDSIYKTDIDTRLWKQVCRNADRTFLWAVERAFIRAPERLRLNWLAPFLCVPSYFNHLDHIFYALWDIIDFNPWLYCLWAGACTSARACLTQRYCKPQQLTVSLVWPAIAWGLCRAVRSRSSRCLQCLWSGILHLQPLFGMWSATTSALTWQWVCAVDKWDDLTEAASVS